MRALLSARRAGNTVWVRSEGSSVQAGASGRHQFGWRDAMDIVVKWRQLAEPNDQVRGGGRGGAGAEGRGAGEEGRGQGSRRVGGMKVRSKAKDNSIFIEGLGDERALRSFGIYQPSCAWSHPSLPKV